MKSFLFIIPLTPSQYLTPLRIALRKACLASLQSQDYDNWKALLIGTSEVDVDETRFIRIRQEGFKSEKLQLATRFIREHKVSADYLIRLDDDDIFNPTLLRKLSHSEFDIYVDKLHYYFDADTGCVSRQVRYFFANTTIQSREHALTQYGELAGKGIKPVNDYVAVLENDHSKIHKYYGGLRIKYAKSSEPVYLRVVSRDSITSNSGTSYDSYLSQFGRWKNTIPSSFKNVLAPLMTGKAECNITFNWWDKFIHRLRELKAMLRYRAITFGR